MTQQATIDTGSSQRIDITTVTRHSRFFTPEQFLDQAFCEFGIRPKAGDVVEIEPPVPHRESTYSMDDLMAELRKLAAGDGGHPEEDDAMRIERPVYGIWHRFKVAQRPGTSTIVITVVW